MALAELTSFVGWIDLSEEDQKRARDYLRSLSEGTIDELGFGVIRDMFADRFFPATSTIMTRGRYFTLVPAIYQWVLEQGLTGQAAERKCLDLEKRLRTRLRENGAIEETRKEDVKRYPASIYWGALRRLGIYQRSGSQAQYFSKLQEYFDLQNVMSDDDKNTHAHGDSQELWDPDFVRMYEQGVVPAPDNKGDFSEDITLDFSKSEAEYIRAKFIGDGETIIAHLLERKHTAKFDYPWQCLFPETLKREVYHAEHFSMLAKLATLVYYQLLIALKQEHGYGESASEVTESASLWWDVCSSRIRDWDSDDFLSLATEANCLRGDDTYFVRKFQNEVRQSSSAEDFLRQERVHKLIEAREKDKRPHKRRLRPGRFLRDWKFPSNPASAYFTDPYKVCYQLDYRGHITSRIVDDIFAGVAQ